jgi:cell division septation protein DedD
MDRKTLLGLITGACMLGLVLFFGGMLVGAGLFMGPDAPQTNETAANGDKMELLAQNTAPRIQTDITPKNAQTSDSGTNNAAGATDAEGDMSPLAAPGVDASRGADGGDPVGDLIAEKAAGVSEPEMKALDENGAPAVPDMGDMSATENAAVDEPAGSGGEDVAAPENAPAAPVAKDVAPAKPVAPQIRTDAKPPKPAVQKDTVSKTAKTTETESTASAALHREPGSKNMPYSIQVGAFKVDANARQRAGELRKKGLEVAVVERGSNDGAWYYVRVGAYPDASSARNGAEKVKKDTGIDGFPVRAEPNDKTID